MDEKKCCVNFKADCGAKVKIGSGREATATFS